MATPVLPYPDMDFTPLDILTAAEMDQMVANDQYLRDFCAGLADGTNLSDGVIQARNLVPAIGDYSTSEQDTGFTWVDGKHIYKKTINFGALPNQTAKKVSTGVSNIEKVINITGYAMSSTQVQPLPFASSGNWAIEVNYDRNANTINVVTAADRTSSTECYITLYYTKSS